MTKLDHIAYSFVHGGFDPEQQGGCSCDDCQFLRSKIKEIQKEESELAFATKYDLPPDTER
jgi:hypothetical protein